MTMGKQNNMLVAHVLYPATCQAARVLDEPEGSLCRVHSISVK